MIKTPAHNLLSQLGRIERIREELLEEVQPLPDDQIRQSSSEEKWNILEIIEHLVLAEDYVFGGSEKPTPKKRTPLHFLRYVFVMSILRSFIKVNVPSRKMKPQFNSSLEVLTKRWEQNHQTLRKYLENLDSNTLSDAVFFHPISGPLTAQQALYMLEVHLKRHHKQVQEIISNK